MATYDHDWIYETIRNSRFFKDCAYKHTWISGSSTPVHPLTIFREDGIREINIEIQCDSMKGKGRYGKFRRLMAELKSRYPRMKGRFVKMDDSCPDYYAITVWKKGFEPKKKGK